MREPRALPDTGRHPAPLRSARVVIGLLIVGSFGPYLLGGGGLRFDHIVIYSIAGYMLLVVLLTRRISADVLTLLAAASLLFAAAAWTLVSSLGNPDPGITTAMRVAGLENFLQPATLLFVAGVAVRQLDEGQRRELLRYSIGVFLVAISVNALVALATIRFNVWPLVKYFVVSTSTIGPGSGWERAAMLGRYIGLFNQPIEAGLAYSVALIGWVYFVGRDTRISVASWTALALLVAGGILSVSKTFLFVGFPLGLVYWLMASGRYQILRLRTWLALAAGSVAVSYALSQWDALDYALRFLDARGQQGIRPLIALLSAGRYGAGESTVKRVFRETADEAPIHGLGYGAFPTLENAYLEYFALGGIVAVLLYVTMIALIAAIGVTNLRASPKEAQLLIALAILITIAGLGGPVLTINRASVPLLVLVAVSASVVLAGRRRWEPVQVYAPAMPVR